MRLFIYLLVCWLAFACSQLVTKREENLRVVPEFLTKDEVIKQANATYSMISYMNEIREQQADPGVQERVSQLIPMKELADGIDERRKELSKVREVKALTIDQLPEDVDLRQYAGSVKEQWNGTCTAFGLISTHEVAQCKLNNNCGLDLSERHFWSFYKTYSAAAALKVASNPVAIESIWPQDKVDKPTNVAKFGKYFISKSEYLGGDSEKAKLKVLNALASGQPVYMWSQTPNGMLSCKAVIPKSANSFADGGHAYSIVGYMKKADPILIVKNSWGSDCGDHGYQYIPFSIWDNADYWEAQAIQQVSIDGEMPTPPIPPAPPKKVTKCEWRWSWKHFWKKVKYCWEEEV